MKIRRLLAGALLTSILIGIGFPTQQVLAEEENGIEELHVVETLKRDVEVTEELTEWGKYTGLHTDILHKYGFTGKNVTIAYVDQPFDSHEEYDAVNVHYVNNTAYKDSLHGPGVLSLLAGKTIGIVPDAEIYYYAQASWERDQKTHVECLYQLIEQNKKLPANKKITMVGFSDNIDETEKNAELFRKAVELCEKNGIMVWFCGEYTLASYIPYTDKNDINNLVPIGNRSNRLYVPTGGRTVADQEGYEYYTDGGTSWAMPVVLGLYGMAKEINPTLTKEELRELMWDSAYVSGDIRLINPVGFISEVLKMVGRDAEADAMLKEVAAREAEYNQYSYVLLNTELMTAKDLHTIANYLATIEETAVIVDVSKYENAEAILKAMKQDAEDRTGNIVGIQILGTHSMVPGFEIDNGVTDLCYGMFSEDCKPLTPDYKVVRLPLEAGEYTEFLNAEEKRYSIDQKIEYCLSLTDTNRTYKLYPLTKYNNFGFAFEQSERAQYLTTEAYIRKPGTVSITYTIGEPAEKLTSLLHTNEGVKLPKGYMVFCSAYQKLDNDYYRLMVEYKMPKDMNVSLLYTTDNGIEQEAIIGKVDSEKRKVLRVDICAEEWETIKKLGLKFQLEDTVYIARYKYE